MRDSRIRSVVRSELAVILRGLLLAVDDSPRDRLPASPGPDPTAALLAALAPGLELTASELRLLVPTELRQSPTRTGLLLREQVDRLVGGRVLRRRRSDRGCSLYRVEVAA